MPTMRRRRKRAGSCQLRNIVRKREESTYIRCALNEPGCSSAESRDRRLTCHNSEVCQHLEFFSLSGSTGANLTAAPQRFCLTNLIARVMGLEVSRPSNQFVDKLSGTLIESPY